MPDGALNCFSPSLFSSSVAAARMSRFPRPHYSLLPLPRQAPGRHSMMMVKISYKLLIPGINLAWMLAEGGRDVDGMYRPIFDQVRYILTTYLSSYIICLKNCPGYLYDANITAYSERHLGILRWSPHPLHLPLLSFSPIQEARPHSPSPLRECLDALHPTPVHPICPGDLISPKA
jgi:hypothetical protein